MKTNKEAGIVLAKKIRELTEENAGMLEALKDAMLFVKLSRQYFPKTIKNRDKFTLEATCASLGKAIHKAEAK